MDKTLINGGGCFLGRVDTIACLAAMKHVDFCELYPSEAIDTNTIAVMNLPNLFIEMGGKCLLDVWYCNAR
jgi:FlaA1/EpsC-like NDP-sugar epimerase